MKAFAAVLIALAAAGAAAQTFPVKPVRIVNPAAPGGNSDVFFRLLQPKMNEVLGQPIVMDYRPGAGGTVGGEVIARSAPDGYTTGIVAASSSIRWRASSSCTCRTKAQAPRSSIWWPGRCSFNSRASHCSWDT